MSDSQDIFQEPIDGVDEEGLAPNQLTDATQQRSKKRSRKQTATWEKEIAKRLVDQVEAHDCLWNTASDGHKNKLQRDTAWLNIAKALDRPAKECSTKWMSLRNNYRVNNKNEIQLIIFNFNIFVNSLSKYTYSGDVDKAEKDEKRASSHQSPHIIGAIQ